MRKGFCDQVRVTAPSPRKQEVFLTPGYLAIATEYADGGGLADFQQWVENAGGMGEAAARALFQQMAAALDFCHRRGVTFTGFGLEAWLLDRAPARLILRQQSSGEMPCQGLRCLSWHWPGHELDVVFQHAPGMYSFSLFVDVPSRLTPC